MKGIVKVIAIAVGGMCTLGVALPHCCGLNATDFEQVNVNGFDVADNEVDMNHYAWAMSYFQPDGADEGHVYVGTGNNILGLASYNIEVTLGLAEPDNEPIRPPEIRRYRPDIGPRVWEKVFDYRDIESEPFETIGFRNMAVYRAQSDGVNYLYAAGMSKTPRLWRSATGDPGAWESVWTAPGEGSVRWMAEHDGLLYLAPAKDIPFEPEIGTIWATDGETFVQVLDDGFGNPDNQNVACLISFNGWLYAGTRNQQTGYEIWKMRPLSENLEDLADPANWEHVQVVANGGPCIRNDIAGTPCIFNGKLYVGSLIFVGGVNFETLNAFKACDIIRIDENDRWETVVGKNSISGYDSGFNHFTNGYCWWMEAHDGWLYASTFDLATALTGLPGTLPRLAASFLTGQPVAEQDPLDHPFRLKGLHAGADLFKSPDGEHWFPVSLSGLGNPTNYGIRTMESVGNTLYLGTANPFQGAEVYAGRVNSE